MGATMARRRQKAAKAKKLAEKNSDAKIAEAPKKTKTKKEV
jgi:hypothetical protein